MKMNSLNLLRSTSIASLIAGAFCATLLLSCGSSSDSTKDETAAAEPDEKIRQRDAWLAQDLPSTTQKPKSMGQDTVRTMSGLMMIIQEKGDETKPVKEGMEVQVNYAGYLTDGTLFDTSIEAVAAANNFNRGGMPYTPLEFVVGRGDVIRGWDEGLTTDMYVGGKRRLIIPPQLGYGSRGAGGVIPPNATLIFDIHVVSAE